MLLRVWDRRGKTVVMVTHDVDEALYLADRLILMTDGPEATVGDVYTVPFPRPRNRAAVLAHPQYHEARRHVIDFLEHHVHQSRPSALDDVLAKRLACHAGQSGAHAGATMAYASETVIRGAWDGGQPATTLVVEERAEHPSEH